jgi:hypothetical protein
MHLLCHNQKIRHKPRRNDLRFDLRAHQYRIFGVDLTAVPGMNALTANMLLTEVRRDLSAFRSAAAFASWLGLCPDSRVSGGKVLSSRTRQVNHRPASARRMAAQALYRSQSWLGQYFAGCGQSSAHQKPSPPRRTNWPASCFTCLPPAKPMTRPSSPNKKPRITSECNSDSTSKLENTASNSWQSRNRETWSLGANLVPPMQTRGS